MLSSSLTFINIFANYSAMFIETLKLFFLLSFYLVFATGHLPVVDRTQFYVGDTFTITCDVYRFDDINSITDDLINNLIVQRTNFTSSSFQTLAWYIPDTVNSAHQNFTFTPSGRNWTFHFSEGLDDTDGNTIKVTVMVHNASCDDAGLYKCMTKLPKKYYASPASNLTALAQVSLTALSVTPNHGKKGEFSSKYDVNETVTMTCTFKGPPGLTANWSFVPIGSSEQSFPNLKDIHNNSSEILTTGSCQETSYTSVLNFQVQETDIDSLYICIVKNGNTELKRASFSISINKEMDNGKKEGSSSNDIVAPVVGGTVGGLLFLVIIIVIIYFSIICSGKKKRKSEDKQQDIETNNSLSPPPVFLSKNSRSHKDDSNVMTWKGVDDVSGILLHYSGMDKVKHNIQNYEDSNPTPTSNTPFCFVDVSGGESNPPPIPARRQTGRNTPAAQLHSGTDKVKHITQNYEDSNPTPTSNTPFCFVDVSGGESNPPPKPARGQIGMGSHGSQLYNIEVDITKKC